LIYKEKAKLLEELHDMKGSRGCLNDAIKELQYAKATAVFLNNANSVKWIENKILIIENQIL
jgi:hypothetical protein